MKHSRRSSKTPAPTLVKLRDLAGNFWNVDTLYILALSESSAGRLAEFADPWLADEVCVHDAEKTDWALGGDIAPSTSALWLTKEEATAFPLKGDASALSHNRS